MMKLISSTNTVTVIVGMFLIAFILSTLNMSFWVRGIGNSVKNLSEGSLGTKGCNCLILFPGLKKIEYVEQKLANLCYAGQSKYLCSCGSYSFRSTTIQLCCDDIKQPQVICKQTTVAMYQ